MTILFLYLFNLKPKVPFRGLFQFILEGSLRFHLLSVFVLQCELANLEVLMEWVRLIEELIEYHTKHLLPLQK